MRPGFRPRAVIDAVRSYAPQFIFTTTLPSMVTAGARAAIRHLNIGRGTRTSSIHGLAHQTRARRRWAAGLGKLLAHCAVDGRRRRSVQGGERPVVASTFHLHPAHQLSHSRDWNRTASNHADAAPYGSACFGTRRSSRRCLERDRLALCGYKVSSNAATRARARMRLTRDAQAPNRTIICGGHAPRRRIQKPTLHLCRALRSAKNFCVWAPGASGGRKREVWYFFAFS
jgi:hypothetical protein